MTKENHFRRIKEQMLRSLPHSLKPVGLVTDILLDACANELAAQQVQIDLLVERYSLDTSWGHKDEEVK